MLGAAPTIRFRLAMILAAHFWDFVRRGGQWIRPVVFENVRKVLACRTPQLGCHVYRCPSCDDIRLVVHSCKSRFCPTCGKHRTDVWADSVLNNLLDVPYHHLVVWLPWALRSTVMQNRRVGLGIVCRAALLSITDWAQTVHKMRVGVIAVLHTFGSDLRVHPHVHLVVTGGGLSLDGERWITTDPPFLMSHGGLKKRWRYHVVRLLREAHRRGELQFRGKISFLAAYPRFRAMLDRLYQLTWYAHIGAALLDPRFTVRYIGRYTKRAVLAEYRITHYDGKLVRYAFKDYAQGGKTSYKTMKVNTFIGRLVRHIPEKHFPMIRYAGLFAPRWKARYLAQARHALGSDTAPAEGQSAALAAGATAPWRDRQAAQQGHDPLQCTRCEQPMILEAVVFGAPKLVALWFEQAGVPSVPWARDGP